MAGMEELLWALAQQQAQKLNTSPGSQFVNAAGAEAGGKLTAAGQSILQSIMAPGDALRGKYNEREALPGGGLSQFDPRMMDDAANLAGVVGLSSMPIPRPAGALGMGGNFSKWFGDSKVVAPDGSPLRVYHGTTGDFDTFRVPTDGAGNKRAVYLTPDPAVASMYGAGKGSVMPAYLRSKNMLTAAGRSREAIARTARESGYDGVLFKNTSDVGGVQDQYAVFDPQQIKSATGNSGAFDPNDPSILRASGLPVVANDDTRRQ